MEVAQENGSKALDVADAGTMIVPGRARRLVCLVQILDAHLVLQPEQRNGIAWDIAALAAGFVVPMAGRWNFLVPTVERLDGDRLVLVHDPVDDDLAVFLKLPHDIANVFDAILVGQH